MNYPLVLSVVSFALMLLSTLAGHALHEKKKLLTGEQRSDSGLLLGAVLTLMSLIIGFSFSMAIDRYDLRKRCEQAEAIAIGTEYSRADLLTPPDASKVQSLLKEYLHLRMLFYTTRAAGRAAKITADAVGLQAELWSTLRPAIAAIPPPLMGVLVTGMDDVINSQRSSQAAWMNRIPLAAWVLMLAIGIGACFQIGFRATLVDWRAFLVVPLAVSVAFFLIADLDSPTGGVIRVAPQNLLSISQSLPR